MFTGRENPTYFARLLGYPKDKAEKKANLSFWIRWELSEDADKLVSHY